MLGREEGREEDRREEQGHFYDHLKWLSVLMSSLCPSSPSFPSYLYIYTARSRIEDSVSDL